MQLQVLVQVGGRNTSALTQGAISKEVLECLFGLTTVVSV